MFDYVMSEDDQLAIVIMIEVITLHIVRDSFQAYKPSNLFSQLPEQEFVLYPELMLS